jgi:hypothetical protein
LPGSITSQITLEKAMIDIVTFSTTVNPDDTLEEHAAAIRDGMHAFWLTMSNALDIALAIGERLNIAKEQVGNGKWGKWLCDDCEITSRSTALLYMRIANHKSEIDAARVLLPDLSLRAARRLLTKKSEQSEAAAEEPDEAAGEEAEAAPPDRAAELLALWKATAITDQKNVLAAIFDTITLATAVNAMPKAWHAALESRARGSLQSRCTTKRDRDTVRKLEKKRPYLELTATPIT